MTTEVVTVFRGTTFKQAVTLLAGRRISAAPVLDGEGRVIGVVSTADLVPKEAYQGRPPKLRRLMLHPEALAEIEKSAGSTVGELMTAPAVTVGPEASLSEAARLMLRHHVKRLPVVARSGRPIGIVSRSDLLTAFLRSDEDIAAAIEAELAEHLPVLREGEIEVSVEQGMAVLDGRAPDAAPAAIATRLARGVDGVVSVVDHLSAPDRPGAPQPPQVGPQF
jgi:CBS-domain-containing membrane protein